MLILKDYIYDLLAQAHPRVFFQRVPGKGVDGKKIAFPYVVFRLVDAGSDDEIREDYELEIDVFGNSTEKEIDDICNAIDSIIDRYTYIDDNIQFSIYRDSPYRLNNLPDPDRTIKRNRLRYISKTYIRTNSYTPPVPSSNDIEWGYF